MSHNLIHAQRFLVVQPLPEDKSELRGEEAASLLRNEIVDHTTSVQARWTPVSCKQIILLLSVCLNVVLSCWLVYLSWPVANPLSHGILSNVPPTRGAYHRFTDYSSREGNNTAEIQSLWDAMYTDHGFVGIDHEWARQNQLAESRPLPSDPSKGIYFIEAYHAMHCVASIRKAHYQMAEHGNHMPLMRSPEHYSHCFDTLKQTLTCHAPDNLFAVPKEQGALVYGNEETDCENCFEGQQRQCRSWEKLREWADKNTACVGNTQLNEDSIAHHFCNGPGDRIHLYN